MMSEELNVLIVTAASLGFVHTVLGPDHYIPFIAMSKAGNWSTFKTSLITILCGIGHVLSSMVIGIIGIGFGIAIGNIEYIESVRGDIASWLLISFGLVYMIWGIRKAIKNKTHNHTHIHSDGEIHSHTHTHNLKHTHVHSEDTNKNLTPWILFTIFIFGPCETLIPILMYPAATKSTFGLIIVTSIFGITTILTMLAIVLVSVSGIKIISLSKVEKYTHALAGVLILLCGISIKILGL